MKEINNIKRSLIILLALFVALPVYFGATPVIAGEYVYADDSNNDRDKEEEENIPDKPDAEMFKVSIDANGGKIGKKDTCKLISVEKNNILGSIKDPTRKDHQFVGWFTKKTGGNKVEPEEFVVSKDLTIYAQWLQMALVNISYGRLNLRDKAGLSGKVIGKYKRATKLLILGSEGNWYKVKVDGKTGYMLKRYVKPGTKLPAAKKYKHKKYKRITSKAQSRVTVKVWKIKKGKKVTGKITIRVNKKIAPEVKKIFKQIYKGDEKFPIYALEGFASRGNRRSEHHYGTAIDINPNENAFVSGKRVLAGSFWNPKKSKYSIPKNGDVVKAFKKYGWHWGGNGWGGKKRDYMHFSKGGT